MFQALRVLFLPKHKRNKVRGINRQIRDCTIIANEYKEQYNQEMAMFGVSNKTVKALEGYKCYLDAIRELERVRDEIYSGDL